MSKFLSVMAMSLMLAVAGCNKTSTETAEGSTDASGTSAGMDACAHCAGTQKATAEGTCPKCGMKVANP